MPLRRELPNACACKGGHPRHCMALPGRRTFCPRNRPLPAAATDKRAHCRLFEVGPPWRPLGPQPALATHPWSWPPARRRRGDEGEARSQKTRERHPTRRKRGSPCVGGRRLAVAKRNWQAYTPRFGKYFLGSPRRVVHRRQWIFQLGTIIHLAAAPLALKLSTMQPALADQPNF